MPCPGNKKHCCYIKGEECPLLIKNYTDETGYFRKRACGLRAELGDWNKVLADPRYINTTKGAWASGVNCRDWPDGGQWKGKGCSVCGANQ